LAETIQQDPLLRVLEPAEIVHSVAGARLAAKQVRSRDAEAVVFNIPVFAFPNFSLLAAQILEMPVLLSSPRDGTLPGLGGILAADGAMAQVGLKSRKMWGNPLEEPALQALLSAFCRASGAVVRLKGSVYGLIGGRSMGMNTGVANPQDWMRQFGVDTDQIDQFELARRASTVDEEEVERAYAWMVEFIDQPRAKLAETCASWPHGFVKMNIEPEDFISRFNTNHAHVIPGVHTESLEIYCDLMEIPVDKVS